jgi:hypothetical protein
VLSRGEVFVGEHEFPDGLGGEEGWNLRELRGEGEEEQDDPVEGARVVGEDSGSGGGTRGLGEVVVD